MVHAQLKLTRVVGGEESTAWTLKWVVGKGVWLDCRNRRLILGGCSLVKDLI